MTIQELEETEGRYAGDDCPRCEDGRLVERYERKLEGVVFLGCDNYPKCEFTCEKI